MLATAFASTPMFCRPQVREVGRWESPSSGRIKDVPISRIIHERFAAEPQFDHLPRQRPIRLCARINKRNLARFCALSFLRSLSGRL